MPGYSATLAYVPEQQIGYVLMINAYDADALATWEEHLLQRLLPTTPSLPLASPQPVPVEFDGWYCPGAPRNQIVAALEWIGECGRLRVAADGSAEWDHLLLPARVPYVGLGTNRLRAGDARDVTAVVVRDHAGRQAMVSRNFYLEKGNWFTVALPQALFFASLAMMGVLLVALPVRVTVAFYRWIRGWPRIPRRELVAPTTAAATLVALAWLATGAEITQLDRINGRTVSLWLGTWLFALLALGSITVCVRRQNAARWSLALAWAGSLAAVFLAGWLAWADWLGVRTWAW